MARTRKSPSVPSTVDPGSTVSPARRAASGSAPDGAARKSATAATATPAARRSAHGLIGGVARGHDDDAVADAYTVAVQDKSARRGEHDARSVVARKHQRPFDGPPVASTTRRARTCQSRSRG